MKKFLSGCALAALLTTVPALAQTAGSAATTTPSTTTGTSTTSPSTAQTTGGASPSAPMMTGSGMGSTTDAAQNAGNKHKLPKEDWVFVKKAAIGGMTEVQAGQVAQQKASAQPVKDFGAMMVKDHTDANNQLKSILDTKQVTPPATIDKNHQKQLDRLNGLSGAEFDKAYIANQKRAHKTTIAAFQKEADSGQDPQLKDFASKTLPILQHHLDTLNGLK